MNSKAQVKGKLGHVVQIHVAVCRKHVSKSLFPLFRAILSKLNTGF